MCSRPFHRECFRLRFLPYWLLDLFNAVSFFEVSNYFSCCYWCCFAGSDHCGGEGTPQILKTPAPDQWPQWLLLVPETKSKSIQQLIRHHPYRIFSSELYQEYPNAKTYIYSTEILHFRVQATETPSITFTPLHAHMHIHANTVLGKLTPGYHHKNDFPLLLILDLR